MSKRYKLRKLEIDRVDLVDVGANQFADIVLAKAFKEEEETDPRAALKEKMAAAKFPGKDETDAPVKPAPKPGGGEGLGIEEKPADSDDNDLKNGTKPFLKPKMKPKAKPEATPGRKPLPPKGEKIPMEEEEGKKRNPFRGRGKAAPILERGDEPLMKHASHNQKDHGNRGGGKGKSKSKASHRFEDRDSPENIKRFLDMVAEMNQDAAMKEVRADQKNKKAPKGLGSTASSKNKRGEWSHEDWQSLASGKARPTGGQKELLDELELGERAAVGAGKYNSKKPGGGMQWQDLKDDYKSAVEDERYRRSRKR